MKIAICSDIHENFNNLKVVLEEIKAQKADQIICLGDYCCPLIAKMFADFNIPSYGIWGNNDADKVRITKIALAKNSNLKVGDETFDELTFDEKKFFISHYPKLADIAFKSKEYDVICYGHDHDAFINNNKDKNRKNNSRIIINPGEVAGHKTGKVSFAIYDTKTNFANIIYIDKEKTVITSQNKLKNY